MENDYKFWTVVDPSSFLPVAIVLLAVLVVIVHAAVVLQPAYNWITPAKAAAK